MNMNPNILVCFFFFAKKLWITFRRRKNKRYEDLPKLGIFEKAGSLRTHENFILLLLELSEAGHFDCTMIMSSEDLPRWLQIEWNV